MKKALVILLCGGQLLAGDGLGTLPRAYTLDVLSYGMYKEVLHMDKDSASIFAILMSSAVSVSWSIMDKGQRAPKDFLGTGLGVGLGHISIKAFSF